MENLVELMNGNGMKRIDAYHFLAMKATFDVSTYSMHLKNQNKLHLYV